MFLNKNSSEFHLMIKSSPFKFRYNYGTSYMIKTAVNITFTAVYYLFLIGINHQLFHFFVIYILCTITFVLSWFSLLSTILLRICLSFVHLFRGCFPSFVNFI